jgi:hypothetical protein
MEDTTQRLLTQMMVKMDQMSARMEEQQSIIAELRIHKEETTSTASQSGLPGQTRQGDLGMSPNLQYGIRAANTLQNAVAISSIRSEAFRTVFKLEDGRDYYVWMYDMMRFMKGEGLEEMT